MTHRSAIPSLIVLMLLPSPGHAIEEVSSRMMALGIGLTGIVEDRFTDLLRNPAYLAFEPVQISTFTFDPGDGFRLGVYTNPTPFFDRSRGGGLVEFELFTTTSYAALLSRVFPLDTFAAGDQSLTTSSGSPPGNLTRSGRSFLTSRYTSKPKLFRGTVDYAVALGERTAIGVDFLYGVNGIGARLSDQFVSTSLYQDEGSNRVSYAQNNDSSDIDETLKSLRFGFLGDLSEQVQLDVELTASRNDGSSFTQSSDIYERITLTADSSFTELELDQYDDIVRPAEKEVIEANLYLHRTGDEGRISMRFSFFSGDASQRNVRSSVEAEADTTTRQWMEETSSTGGWTGGLVGLGGSHRLTDDPLTLHWGGFYGFLRGWQVDEETRSDGVEIEVTHTDREENRWDNHLWQINLASEYAIRPSVTMRIGARAMAILTSNDRTEEFTAVPDPEAIDEISRSRYRDLDPEVGLTGGFTLNMPRWMRIDIYTPSFSSLNDWILESTLTF